MSRFYAVLQRFSGIIAGESTRLGGVSPHPYASLNLGKSTDDSWENVQENRRLLVRDLGFTADQLAMSYQVHGSEALRVEAPGMAQGYDALFTNRPGILLAVTVADCTPILVYDEKNRAIAAIHAGWKGTVAGIVSKTLERMAEAFGTQGADCAAWVGTCIDSCSFEVGDEVAAQFSDDHKNYQLSKSKFTVDLKAANAAQLRAFGIPEEKIEISPFSTVLNNDRYFSHRKEQGVTGRFWGFIALRDL